MPRHNFNRFGRHRTSHRAVKPAVMTSTGVQAGNRTACHGCKQSINVGEPFTRLRLQKRYAVPCGSCGVAPKRAKRYHTQCVPTDLNAAMGFDPTKHASFTPPRPAANNGGAVPPPPKPKPASELTLEAMVMLEAALKAQLKQRQRPMTPELEADFRKLAGMKAHVVRPGNANEGDTALTLALQRLVKMVLS